MSNETYLTVRGYAGADPTLFSNGASGRTAVLRVGVTARTRNRETGKYEDGRTAWYSVRCYGDLGENVALTIRKGAPVLVRGKLVQRRWEGNDRVERTDLVIVADSLGLELTTVAANYAKSRRGAPPSLEGGSGRDAGAGSRGPQAASQNVTGAFAVARSIGLGEGAGLADGVSGEQTEETMDPRTGEILPPAPGEAAGGRPRAGGGPPVPPARAPTARSRFALCLPVRRPGAGNLYPCAGPDTQCSGGTNLRRMEPRG